MSLLDIDAQIGPAKFCYHYGHYSAEDQARHGLGPEYESLGILVVVHENSYKNKTKAADIMTSLWLSDGQVDKFIEFAERLKKARKRRTRPVPVTNRVGEGLGLS
ncbi:hypothetical protein [Desulfotomaculum sp. 1211_IL3151]|uniref:hypothetical protein n=1 Tax=Desulfotomaculum sp. 1211_IL3151 TaxID=3084055 RepID=UPI002FDAE23D